MTRDNTEQGLPFDGLFAVFVNITFKAAENQSTITVSDLFVRLCGGPGRYINL